MDKSEQNEVSSETNKYVVVRSGFRVSDETYDSMKDPRAISELEFWQKIVKNQSTKEKVEIVKFDPALHTV